MPLACCCCGPRIAAAEGQHVQLHTRMMHGHEGMMSQSARGRQLVAMLSKWGMHPGLMIQSGLNKNAPLHMSTNAH